MQQSATSVMSTIWDRCLFPKDGALTDTNGRTWPPAKQMIKLHSNLSMPINIQHRAKPLKKDIQ